MFPRLISETRYYRRVDTYISPENLTDKQKKRDSSKTELRDIMVLCMLLVDLGGR